MQKTQGLIAKIETSFDEENAVEKEDGLFSPIQFNFCSSPEEEGKEEEKTAYLHLNLMDCSIIKRSLGAFTRDF